MYVSYEFYSNEYGGKLPLEAFKQLNLKAMGLIDYFTFDRAQLLDPMNLKLNMAACELIDHLHEVDKTDDKIITSESVGTWSRTYATEANSNRTKAYNIIAKYLMHEGVMYRGRSLNVSPRYYDI
mgnify:FL=1